MRCRRPLLRLCLVAPGADLAADEMVDRILVRVPIRECLLPALLDAHAFVVGVFEVTDPTLHRRLHRDLGAKVVQQRVARAHAAVRSEAERGDPDVLALVTAVAQDGIRDASAVHIDRNLIPEHDEIDPGHRSRKILAADSAELGEQHDHLRPARLEFAYRRVRHVLRFADLEGVARRPEVETITVECEHPDLDAVPLDHPARRECRSTGRPIEQVRTRDRCRSRSRHGAQEREAELKVAWADGHGIELHPGVGSEDERWQVGAARDIGEAAATIDEHDGGVRGAQAVEDRGHAPEPAPGYAATARTGLGFKIADRDHDQPVGSATRCRGGPGGRPSEHECGEQGEPQARMARGHGTWIVMQPDLTCKAIARRSAGPARP